MRLTHNFGISSFPAFVYVIVCFTRFDLEPSIVLPSSIQDVISILLFSTFLIHLTITRTYQ